MVKDRFTLNEIISLDNNDYIFKLIAHDDSSDTQKRFFEIKTSHL